MTTRILVTGSRRWWDRWTLWRRLDKALEEHGPLTVVHGGACGLDDLAGQWAELREQEVECHAADWSQFGRRAGPMRNAAMVQAGAALCIGFPDPESKGTHDCLRRARHAGIPTDVCPPVRPEVEVLCDRLLAVHEGGPWPKLARWMRFQDDNEGWSAVEQLLYMALHLAEEAGDALTIRLLQPWVWREPPEVLAYRPHWLALRAGGELGLRVTWRRRARAAGSTLPPVLDFRCATPLNRQRMQLVALARCEKAPLEVLESLVVGFRADRGGRSGEP